jgi:multimeric flavodoxin WrbA
MNLLIVNGSPRGRKSNSDKMLNWLFNDQQLTSGISIDKVYAVDRKDRDQQLKLMEAADSLLVIFPLYTDGMPGITKEVFEQMEDIKEDLKGKTISFIVHSGFPEPKQSRSVEKYVMHLAALLDMRYLGTVVMPGSEALSMAPESMFKKKFDSFRKIGSCIIEGKQLDAAALKLIAGPEVLPPFQLFVMKHVNIGNIFWNRMLKKNNAFDKRYDSPYK